MSSINPIDQVRSLNRSVWFTFLQCYFPNCKLHFCICSLFSIFATK